ncbi:tetratricopeptide repeat-containing glycosyltransferase family 2 protein [Bacillus sp. NPDC077027]|uniref:tetratricopeptide repeat-containing glycosyltransferase family 2 protein n=1 Tax=Bacillus sp. NPDC077027 TaxID=3390548 RepID=UPI003CFE1168
MISISVCMIVKNEEEVLDDCLSSIQDIADEIIIVDTGSTDQTKAIAQKYTEHVIDFEWVNHFAKARNFAFSHATKEYILWMDADDVFLKEDQEKFIQLKQTLNTTIDAVSMFYHVGFDAEGNVNFKYRRNRLVKRERDFQWHGAVHEYLHVYGHIIPVDIAVTHQKRKKTTPSEPGRNLRIYESMLERNEEMTPRDLFYFANELKDHGQHLRAIRFYNEFLATKQCWIEDEIRACQYLADCYLAVDYKEGAMQSLLRSFLFDQPRPEFCCRLGDYFKEKSKHEAAIFWYQLALSVPVNDTAFTLTQYTTWYPHLQLCYCYWQLGNLDQAKKHHVQSEQHYPTHPSVIHNGEFFKDQEK